MKITTSYPAALDRVATAMYGAWMFSPKAAEQEHQWWDTPHEAGTGPWMLESYAPNEETVFVRNPDYWGGWKDGQFQKVVIKYVDESATQRQMLEAGEVDFADGLALDSVPALKDNPDVKIVEIPSIQNYVLQFNCAAQAARRQARASGALVRPAVRGHHRARHQRLRRTVAGADAREPLPHDPNLFQYTYDLEKAKQLLAEAGYPDGGFKLKLTYASDEQFAPKFVPLIKEALRRARRRGRPATAAVRAAVGHGEGPGRQAPGPLRADLVARVPRRLRQPLLAVPHPGRPAVEPVVLVRHDLRRPDRQAFSAEPTDPDKATELYNEARRCSSTRRRRPSSSIRTGSTA